VRRGQRIAYRSGDAEITAYLAQPEAPGTYPGMVVCQAIHGLTPHVELVADHLAESGYVAIVPALYSRLESITCDTSQGVPPEARSLSERTPDPQIAGDYRAAVDYLLGLPSVGDEPIGGVGFCAGGRQGLFLLAADSRVRAFAAFYPTVIDEAPTPARPVLVWDAIKDIHGSVCVLIGDQDHPTVEKYRDRLRNLLAEHKVDYEFHLYAGGQHGFSNAGSPSFQEDVTRAAWAVADDFLARKLK
jgi:carboxymethylenebutenolidase